MLPLSPRIPPSRLLLAAAGAGLLYWLKRNRTRPFKDETILITGGSRGLGYELACQLGARGNRIGLCGRDADSVEVAVRRLREAGVQAFGIAADVRNPEAMRHWVEEAVIQLGPVDTLINNAAIIGVAPFDNLEQSDFEQAMDIIFWGTYHATMAVLPGMRQSGRGRIVNITSIGGKVSVPHLLPYCCAKFAMVAFSQGLRSALNREGISVHTIVPGLMRTGSYLTGAEFKGRAEQEFAWFGLADNMPGLSISAEAAAAAVIKAAEEGRAEAVLTAPAQMLARLQGVAPNLTAELLLAASHFLPDPGPGGGADTGQTLQPRLDSTLFDRFTSLGQSAARKLQNARS